MKVVFNSSNISGKGKSKLIQDNLGDLYVPVHVHVYVLINCLLMMMIHTFFFILNDLTSAKSFPG